MEISIRQPHVALSPFLRTTHKVCLPTIDKTEIPYGFPTSVSTKLAWSAHELADESAYVVHLTDSDKEELDKALSTFIELGLDGNLVNCHNFPLPHLQHKLRRLAEDLYNGKGFFVLRGIEPERYCVEDSTVVFLGIQSYIAELRMRQDEVGNMIVHVFSDPLDRHRSQHVRHSNKIIPFHTDPEADILAFQTRSTAISGGKCVISSGYTIYNELARTRPDVVHTLAQADWPFALPYFHQRPILFHHNSRLILSYTKSSLLGDKLHPRPSSIPSMTPTQREAFTLLNTVAEKHRLEFTTQAGDLHFVNNLALLHRRDEFVDSETQRRHLVRMHLRSERRGWDIPDCLRKGWEEALDEKREERWHIEPMPESFFPTKLGCY